MPTDRAAVVISSHVCVRDGLTILKD